MNTERQRNGAKPATASRIYDYFLGGTHNFPADREAAQAIMAMFPQTRMAALINRAFLRRAVGYAAASGIKQFLDIGSGIPTEGNVHEIAQAVTPDARVVYVDIDPVAVAESQEMLERNEFATAICADARDPRAILEHPQLSKLIDFSQPVAVLLVALLHFLSDDEEATNLVRRLVDVLAPGSFLVVSHGTDETPDEVDASLKENLLRLHEIYRRQTSATLRLRSRAEVESFFAGLELVDPGVAWLLDWRPEADDPTPAPDDLSRYGFLGGVGRVTDGSGE